MLITYDTKIQFLVIELDYKKYNNISAKEESPLLLDRRLIWDSGVSAKLINDIYWFHHEFIALGLKTI